jgi:hypothetical protein
MVGADGALVKAVLDHNKKGSVDGDMAVKYLDLIARCFPDLSVDNPIVLIFDGCPTHITAKFLRKAKSLGMHCVLRPPHTTSHSQGEDVANFGPFKTKLDKSKSDFVKKKNNGKTDTTPLTVNEMMEIAKAPWMAAFSTANNKAGWAKTGLYPYTRCVEHMLRAAEDKKRIVRSDYRKRYVFPPSPKCHLRGRPGTALGTAAAQLSSAFS